MEAELVSLFIVVLAAFICPVLSALVPHKLIPETVFLLVAGMLIGPNVFDLVHSDVALGLLSDLGLGFLFLLAGYEIDVKELSGKGGKHGLRTWIMTFIVGLAIGIPLGLSRGDLPEGFSVAIILTTTAFGTLVPILKERKLDGTPVGKGVVEYGVWGELCPVLAMAVLLSTRATWVTILLLIAFVVLAVLSVLFSKAVGREGSRFARFMDENSETNSQSGLRFDIMLLIGLLALSAVFDLDIVLGAFAAGFALRAILPQGNASLEHKLNGMAYGFFIPIFFISSGMGINPSGVLEEPLLLVVFIVSLLLIRAVPIFISLCIRKDTKSMDPRMKASIAFYCTTALPLIVAVSSVAVSIGAFSQEVASVLIAAGGITVLLMPLLASVTMHTIDADLSSACKEIAGKPRDTFRILNEHRKLERRRSKSRNHVTLKRSVAHTSHDPEDAKEGEGPSADDAR